MFRGEALEVILAFMASEELLRIQLAHSSLYEKRVPQVMCAIDLRKWDCKRKARRILESGLSGAGAAETKLWVSMRRMSIDLLQKYWDRVEDTAPMLDVANARFDSWWDSRGRKCVGMTKEDGSAGVALTSDLTRHGICRTIRMGKRIIEATYKDGKNHGLYRDIFPDSVFIGLYREGDLLCGFEFDRDFNEPFRGRMDMSAASDGLRDLDAKYFKLN